ncbi:MAG: redox-sensing transcriptional repressor Rex [Longimicrobiales bacterium]
MRKIAESTVRRLSLYLRFLEDFEEQGIDTVSSEALATRGHTTSAQVRKDLSFFGSFGKRGLGYSVPELASKIRDILGLGRSYRVAVIGAGNIGAALVHFGGFDRHGFHVVSLYDTDPEKIGTERNGITVRDQRALEGDMAEELADIAIVATPAPVAQELVDRLVASGVKAFLNFAPVQLKVPDDVVVKTVSLALELEALSYGLRNR